MGGAHRDWDVAAVALRGVLREQLAALAALDADELMAGRYEKFRRIGAFEETGAPRR